MRWFLIVVGVVLILLGALWTLQGIGILGGSVMTGQTFWAVVGAILLVVGVVLCVIGMRRKPAMPA
jgi:hypothetical protein